MTSEVTALAQPTAYGRGMAMTATAPHRSSSDLPSPPTSGSSVGPLLREWRERRRLSQLELASRADVSTRHVSFVENGRSKPTSEMILRLAEQLDVPLRERNTMLLSGGFAPAYPERALAEPSMAAVSAAIAAVLHAHESSPALVIDHRWDLVDSNRGLDLLLSALLTPAAAPLLEPPVNVLRLSLHPDGLAPSIVNLAEWRSHLLARLTREVVATADPDLQTLHDELRGYPAPDERLDDPLDVSGLLVPLRLRVGDEVLSLVSMTTVFGTPREVTVSELAIESFHPADPSSTALLRRLQRGPRRKLHSGGHD